MKKVFRLSLCAAALMAAFMCTAQAADSDYFRDQTDDAAFSGQLTYDEATRTYTASYDGVKEGQYVLLVVEKNEESRFINEDTIMYIDQAAATAEGVEFKFIPKKFLDCEVLLGGKFDGQQSPIVLGELLRQSEPGELAPTGLACEETDAGVALNWNAASGVSSYAVYRSVDGGEFAWLADSGTNQYVDKSASGGHTYAYKVCCYMEDGTEGEISKAVTITIKLHMPVPAKPYDIKNVVSGVHVYWKATKGADKYGLWRSENGKDGTYKWIANPTVPHFTDTKVESGKTYFYKVTSMDVETNTHSEKSEAKGIVYTSTPDITTRKNIAAGVELGWEKITGATGYAIYRKSYSGTDAWVRIATIEGNDTFSWTDTSVKNNNGSEYRYTIRALGGADMKTLSGCRNTGRTMVRLSSQVLKSAVKADKTSIKCTWTTSKMVTGYEVRFMIGDQVYKTVTVGNYKTGVKTFTGLKAGEDYTIQVRTYKKVTGVGSFYSDWSSIKNVSL